MTPEQQAREKIDQTLMASGWAVQDRSQMNLGAGVAVREFPLETGFADYLLFVDRKAVAVVEAKAVGATLSAIIHQLENYSAGVPPGVPEWGPALLFLYESSGVETMFTCTLDPEPRSRVESK
jgi:type I restriction enzyme, R subunit